MFLYLNRDEHVIFRLKTYCYHINVNLVIITKMSYIHLSEGFAKPKKVEGKLQLYSMECCPFAKRVRIVLLVKQIPHDIININLLNRPDWFFEVNPTGQVPALDIGDTAITESLDICNYLDEKYPEPPLYPAEAEVRERDKQLIEKIQDIFSVDIKLLTSTEKKLAQEWMNEFDPHLQVFEDELIKRGSSFFGGKQPGMVDYMLSPWIERVDVISLALGQKLPIGDNDCVNLKKWKNAMLKEPAIQSVCSDPKKIYQLFLAYQRNDVIEFTNLLSNSL